MKLKPLPSLLILVGGLTLFGCNGSSSDTTNTETETETSVSTSTISVSGTASAPSGTVAFLRKNTFFNDVSSIFISPVYASMTGLEAVQNALVELIQIDNDGNQVGDIITSTYTSTTGNYQLTIPEEYELNGSLVLRISGNNDTEMRAQLVDEEVDINPITEYVLQKYIALDIDLSALTTSSVVELYGKLDEYDLSSSTDLASTLSTLSEDVGEFVESSIEIANSDELDATGLDGNYRLIGYESKLVDFNYADTGITENHIGFKSRRGNLTIDGDTDGTVRQTYATGTSAYRRVLKGIDGVGTYMNSLLTNTYTSTITETGTYIDNNVLVFNKDYTETINSEDNEAELTYAEIQNYQKVSDSNVAVNLHKSSSAYYGLDGTELNEDDLTGHQIYRGLRVIAEVPTAMTPSDLTGSFGRVYLEAYADSHANVEYSIENNILTFSGSSTFSYSSSTVQSVSRDTTGTNYYSTSSEDGSSGVSITVDSDGNISELDGDYASDGYINGFVNADYNFIAVTELDYDTDSNTDIEIGTTLAVKLPSTAPTLSGKTYRVLAFGNQFSGKEIHLLTSTFGSKLNFTSETSGNVTSTGNNLYLAKLGEEDVAVDVDEETTSEFTVSVSDNSMATVTISGTEGEDTSTTTLNGYFNETASMGVFTSSYKIGSNDPRELGLVVLIQIDSK